jgi:prolyl-tRNA synthetase
MKWSKSYLYTLKDAPADAEIPSHQLMSRAGLIRKVAPGIYTYGNLALRAIRKFEKIIREELDRRHCQEILMPMVQPAQLWQETGRWTEMGDGLLKFKNRNDHEFCLGATHEEVVTDYVRRDVKSYRDLPANLYQIQTKYRDELRPRFGLMRGREFIMKDAYSFDADQAGALKSYEQMYQAYTAIFNRIGAKFRIVEADAGNIGGSQTHEFQLLADAGEDHLMVCDNDTAGAPCTFAANIEVAPALDREPPPKSTAELLPMEAFATPGLKSIGTLAKSLKVAESELVKTLFFAEDEGGSAGTPASGASGASAGGTATVAAKPSELKALCVLVRGSDEVNPVKLKNVLGLSNPPRMLTDLEVKAVSGAYPGSCGPVGLTIPVYMDNGLTGRVNFVVGANRDAEHLKNVNIGRDFTPLKTADLRTARAGDLCPRCRKGSYQSFRGIEVGHVFYLGTKYSTKMQANFLTPEGDQKPVEMGCYGIGVSRTVQAVIEQSYDKDGIIWPIGLAPFEVHLVVLDPENQEVLQAAEIIYRDLKMLGLDALMDDRIERPGVKFKDADLLGMPIRINIGARGLQNGEVELINRRTKAVQKVKLEEATDKAQELARTLSAAPADGESALALT